VITDLGKLTDAPENAISIHNRFSWGGDLISDVYGKLYLFSAPQHVFVIDVASRIATYLGQIKNISPTFTVNGAAVDQNDNIVISSANTFEGFYKINIKDLAAEKLNTTSQVFNASDLAGSNLLYQNQLASNVGTPELVQREGFRVNIISIYPNPVSGNQFKLNFDNIKTGRYNVVLNDVQGKVVMAKQVNIRASKQQETVQLKFKPAGGVYMVNITDAQKKSVFTDKLVIN
jgi:hypothetical protein